MAAGFQRALTKSFRCLIVISLLLGLSEARDLLVGGRTDAWQVPSSQSNSLNQWAERSRFVIGDSLVWKYDSQKDSVLQVTKEAYLSCNTSNPIGEYKDGNTKVKLDRSGAFYFISGEEGHCEKGQRLQVVVLSAKHRYTSFSISPAPSPAPSPGQFEGPAVAPTSSAAGLKSGMALAITLGVLLWSLF